MHNKWDLGEAVRVTRNVRNDGTYPGEETGALLIRRGSVGNVVDVGTFLQDQIIYSVHFLDDGRIVGCREEELMGAEEPWVPSAYEFRQKVRAAKTLASNGETLVVAGSIGEVLKVLRDAPGGVAYHVHFESLPGRPLLVSEGALAPLVPQAACHDG
ncbi:MAG: nitrogen fixation protein NifZ [Gammaproteobacteria bacterium]|nr:nitrogen fixation protein NifZ [Gammaproteobacteria bacterium]MBU1414054.1 nitrogen fixation protein NifZ [Gammaproteobacteria bacterium]